LDVVLGWRIHHRQATTWRLAIHGGEASTRALRDGLSWAAGSAGEVAHRKFRLIAVWWKLWGASEAATARLCGSIVTRWRGLGSEEVVVQGHATAAFASPQVRGNVHRAWLVN